MAADLKDTMHVWARLVRAHTAALTTIERALAAAGLPFLEWYDVLWELETGGDLRPRDLQSRLLLAQYNLSRLLDRMVSQGVVQRLPCPEDRRGQLIAITAEGHRLRQRMWPVYSAATMSAIGRRLSADEAEVLSGLLELLISGPTQGEASDRGT